jgi:hypothetical protein
MSEPSLPPQGFQLFSPIEVRWNSERSELVIYGGAIAGIDQHMRMGFVVEAGAARELLRQMKALLEAEGASVTAPRSSDRQ